MAQLGKNQLQFLAGMAHVNSAVVVPDKLTKALVKRGLLVALASDGESCLAITPDGYRAIADALGAGSLVRPPLKDWGKS